MKKKKFNFTIAIDGSSASGKTTGSKFISKMFGFKLLSSGKLYRYIAFKIIKNKNKYNHKFIDKISKEITFTKLNAYNLYHPKITNLSSIIAKKKKIRNSLKKFQIDFIKKNSKVVIEGRDIASKIMPNADLKIFFKCTLEEKAKRRLKEFRKSNKRISLVEVKKTLKQRDFSDKNRKESPLLFTKGAVLVDTTNLNLNQMKTKLKKLVEGAIKTKKYGSL